MLSTNSQRDRYLSRAGLYFGILGAISLLFLVLIFQEDWTHRYSWMIAFISFSLIVLLLALKIPQIGGALLAALGIVVFFIDAGLKVGIVGRVAGIGLGYTVVLISMPLIVSGVLFILSGRKPGKSTKKDD